MNRHLRQLITPPVASPKFDRALSILLGNDRPVALRHDPSIYRKKLTNGMYSRIARQLGVGRQHVTEVAHGNRQSKRIEAAIKAELHLIDRSVTEFERTLTKGFSEVEL